MVRGPKGLVALALAALWLSSGARADALAQCTDTILDAAERLAACDAALARDGLGHGDEAAAHGGRAQALIAMGATHRALGEIALAVSLAPDDTDFRRVHGDIYAGLEKFELARQSYRASLRLDPSNRAAQEGCRVALQGLGYDAEDIRRSLEFACALIGAGIAYAADISSPTPALDALKAALDDAGIAEPLDPFALGYVASAHVDPEVDRLFRQAVTLAAEHDLAGAAAAYASAARLDPAAAMCDFRTNEQAYLMRLYDRSLRPGAYGDALVPRTLDDLNAVLSETRTDPHALRERALIYAAVKAWGPAVDDLQLALLSDPHPEEVYALLARTGFAIDEIVTIMGTNYVIAGKLPPYFEGATQLHVNMLDMIEGAREHGGEGAFVEVTRGQILSELAITEDSEDRERQALAAYDLGLTYLGDPDTASELETWSAMTAHFGRAMINARLGTGDVGKDMEAMEAYWEEPPTACADD